MAGCNAGATAVRPPKPTNRQCTHLSDSHPRLAVRVFAFFDRLVVFGRICRYYERVRATGPQRLESRRLSLLDWLLRSINRLSFLEISQKRETGEGHQEMFERMSTEDKVRMAYMIGELKQFGAGVQQRGDDPIESPSISRPA